MGTAQNKSSISRLSVSYILRWFSPRWFIFVMGTGALANVYQMIAGRPTGTLHVAAVILLLIALVAFPVASFLMIIRFIVGFDCVLKEWRHASLIQFYSAISISAAVCVTGLLNIPVTFIPTGVVHTISITLWWISCLTGILFIFFTPYKVMTENHAEPRRALGFWFLPPVGLFVLVFAGNFLALRMLSNTLIYALLLFNILVLGVAIVLTVIFYTFVLFRYFFYNFPRKDVAPSFMIGVAPVGVFIIAINTLLPVVAKSGLSIEGLSFIGLIIKIVSLLIWSFGLWWLVVASMVILTYFIKQGVPVTLGYWAFIFPPAAYTIASLIVAKTLNLVFIKYIAIALAGLLTVAWIINVVLTIRGMIDRTIFDVSPTFKGDIPYL
ncbi:MAG: hypothetical protein JW925_09995 [Syntrophaceae bacterium]|nr:hypothetical protein [Syntrophaceae bacterium]